MSTLAVALLAMFAVGGVVYALLYPTLSGEKRAEKRRKEFAGPSAVRGVDREAQARNKRGQIAQSLKEIENRENARNKVSLETRIAQAGLMLWLASGNWILGLAGLFVGGFGLPAWFLKRCKSKRLKKFITEFPNALDVIVRGIKAGLPVNDCLRIIANEAQEPVKGEFRQII